MGDPLDPVLRLDAARLRLKKKFPALAPLVDAMAFDENERLPVRLCGTKAGGILYNTLRWMNPDETVDTLAFRVARECARLVAKHWAVADRLSEEYGNFDAELFAEMSDIALNPSLVEVVGKDGYRLSIGKRGDGRSKALLPEDYGLPPGYDAEWYYRRVHAAMAAKVGILRECAGSESGGGSAAGYCLANEDEEFGPGEVAVMGAVEAWAGECKATGAYGTLPGCMRIVVEKLTADPVVNWDDEFRKVLGDTVKKCAGWSNSAFHLRNVKLQPAVDRAHAGRGAVPMVPGHDSRKPRMHVSIDVSGSCVPALRMFYPQAAEIVRAYGDAIEFSTFDTRLRVFPHVIDIAEVQGRTRGGGGTTIEVVFNYIAGKHPSERPKILVVFTDGDGRVPNECPPGLHVIWCLTPGGRRPMGQTGYGRVEWGEVVQLR